MRRLFSGALIALSRHATARQRALVVFYRLAKPTRVPQIGPIRQP